MTMSERTYLRQKVLVSNTVHLFVLILSLSPIAQQTVYLNSDFFET